ncbi:MAG: D-tyrosyl-tRNA(Tyr) deacylase [Flavobacteriales bacterium]|nr:D-tyrosyl-tRNA(Tyr) deacylase [Flavobacteriales bacterium]
MRAVIQRVSSASVEVAGQFTGKIGEGLLVLVGVAQGDTAADAAWLAGKIARMRIFSDDHQNMNLSVQDIQGEILVISQFTLHAQVRKGNRPSFIKAASPQLAVDLYREFIDLLQNHIQKKIQTGIFGAMMQVSLINSGPVTIIIDSKSDD